MSKNRPTTNRSQPASNQALASTSANPPEWPQMRGNEKETKKIRAFEYALPLMPGCQSLK